MHKKKSLILGTICLIFGLSQSQWLETTIYVPDSFAGVVEPQAITHNATNNMIYVGGRYGECVVVIDGETNQRIAKIPAGKNIYSLNWNPRNNKVYSANRDDNSVTIIDGSTNRVITTIRTGNSPSALCYNSVNNKLYCANSNSNSIVVIDGASDSVIATILVGEYPCALVDNPVNNKVYCVAGDSVIVIDGASNQVIATIRVGKSPTAFTYNPQENRIYVANYNGSSISVIRDVIGLEEGSRLNRGGKTTKIYPNPANSVLLVQLPQGTASKTIKIFDSAGRMLREFGTAKGKCELRIPVSGMSPGVYFLYQGKQVKRFQLVH
jgi:YVTN family beta-propeller protein